MPHPVEEDVGVVDRVDIWVTASARPLARSGQRLNLSSGIIHLYGDEPKNKESEMSTTLFFSPGSKRNLPFYCQKKCFDALEAKKYDKKQPQPK